MAEGAVGVEGEGKVDVDPFNFIDILLVGNKEDGLFPRHHQRFGVHVRNVLFFYLLKRQPYFGVFAFLLEHMLHLDISTSSNPYLV